jgi:hypothetical protein
MGAARRNARRRAREAAQALIDSGIPASAIGEYADLERDKRFLGKIVDQAEKRLDGGTSEVSLRDGMAAVKERRALRDQQIELADRKPDAEDLTPEPEPLPRVQREIAAPASAAASAQTESRAPENNSVRAA